MGLRRLPGVLVLVTGVVGLLTVGAAEAGPSPPEVKLKVAKRAGGPYSADGVRRTIAEGAKKKAHFKARSLTGDVVPAELGEFSEPPEGYVTKYYKRKGANITDEVKGPGYEFNAKPGKPKRFKLKIRRTEGAVGSGCILPYATGDPGGPLWFNRIGVNQPFTDCTLP